MFTPFQGYIILDFTHFVAGPWATMMLADLGARVIKVEPLGGDIARNAGGVYARGESAIFLGFNRNKFSLAVDLKREEGMVIIDRLARRADVLVENFRPGTADRLGIGYSRLAALRPNLIYCSISAFGEEGPYAARPANDPIIQAVSGAMLGTGEPGGQPVRLGVSVPDFAAGVVAAVAIAASLLERERTGVGKKIELNLLDVQLFSMMDSVQAALISGQSPPRKGSGHPDIAASGAYACSDGTYLYLAPDTEDAWEAVASLLVREGLIDQGVFPPWARRWEEESRAKDLLAKALQTRPRHRWLERLGHLRVPAAPVNAVSEALAAAEATQTVHHPLLGPVQTLKLPLQTSSEGKSRCRPWSPASPPPLLGEHTEQILLELGYDREEIQNLIARGVIRGQRKDVA